MCKRHTLPLLLILLFCIACKTLQDHDSSSHYTKIYNFSDKLFGSINSKSQKLHDSVAERTEKNPSCLERQEKKLQKQLWKRDVTVAQRQTLHATALGFPELPPSAMDKSRSVAREALAINNYKCKASGFKNLYNRLYV